MNDTPNESGDVPDEQPNLIELGKKGEIFGEDKLKPLRGIYGRPTQMPMPMPSPTQMPRLPEGHDVICGFDQGLGERLFICKNKPRSRKGLS